MNKTTEALELAEEALEELHYSSGTVKAVTLYKHALAAIREALAEQEKQEPFMCEPVPPVSEDGWTDWVSPKPQGYLMQCCDCGLIHEVDSRVAKYEPMPSEEFEVVDDPDMQCQWRMRRRDDLSNPVKQEPVAGVRCKIVESCKSCQHSFGRKSCALAERDFDSIERTSTPPEWCPLPLYAAPVSAKREWVDMTPIELAEAFSNKGSADAGIRAVITAFKEKNK